jgi:hypothetical protein
MSAQPKKSPRPRRVSALPANADEAANAEAAIPGVAARSLDEDSVPALAPTSEAEPSVVIVDPAERRRDEANHELFHALGVFLGTSRSVAEFLGLAAQVAELDSPQSWLRTVDRLTAHLNANDKRLAVVHIDAIINRQFTRDEADRAKIGEPLAGVPVSGEVAVVVGRLAREFYVDLHASPRLPMFFRSLLTTQISAVELLLGALHRAYLVARPESLATTKSLSLAELTSFESIQLAVESVIEGEVDDFRRESFTTWDKWFQERLNLKFVDFSSDVVRLQEGIERRNVVVHNDSRVSRQYLERLSRSRLPLPALGSILSVDDEYIRNVLDDTLTFCNLLAFATWRKIGVTVHSPDQLGDELLAYLMSQDRWDATLGFCTRALAQNQFDTDSYRTVLRVNSWLATKRTRGLAAVEAEVLDWDVSALDDSFAMAREALLDHQEHLAPRVERLLERDELPINAVHTWPLLQEFRATPAYAAMVSKFEPWKSTTADDAPISAPTRRPKSARAATPKNTRPK